MNHDAAAAETKYQLLVLFRWFFAAILQCIDFARSQHHF